MSLINRIKQIQEKEGYTASQFAEKLGIQRSGLSHIYSGRNKPSIGFIQKLIYQFPQYNVEWILNGQLPMFKQTDNQKSHTSANPDKKSEPNLFNTVESEDAAPYHVKNFNATDHDNTPKTPDKKQNTAVKQIILVYEDDTFEVLHSKNTK